MCNAILATEHERIVVAIQMDCAHTIMEKRISVALPLDEVLQSIVVLFSAFDVCFVFEQVRPHERFGVRFRSHHRSSE
jgi:hypothetical protein